MPRNFTMDDVTILHEDNSVLVVVKPQNIPSQADNSGDTDLLTLLKEYIKNKYDKPGNVYLGLVHRLDRPTGGVMVFAKNSKAAERLSKQIVDGDVTKQYLATVLNCPKERKGLLRAIGKMAQCSGASLLLRSHLLLFPGLRHNKEP